MDEFRFGQVPATGHFDPAPGTRYAPVRIDKFVLMCLATLGLYPLVWFYRNWRYVRDELGEDLRPALRAFFGGIFYFALVQRLRIPGGVLLAILYLVGNSLWRLPDPWWMVGYFNFLALLPAVVTINRMNRFTRSAPAGYGWRKRNAWALLGAVALGLAWLGASSPPTFVQAADEVPDEVILYLLTEGILDPDEELLWFYSPGLVSIEGDGALVSDWGVTAYWTDPVTEDLSVGFISYEDIVEVEVNPSTSWLEDTVVRISDVEGNWLVFVLSAEEGRDQEVLAEVEERRRQAEVREGSI